MDLVIVSGFLKEAASRIAIALGIMLMVTALFFGGLNVSNQIVFSITIVVGVLLMSSGFAVLFGLFLSGFRSRSCFAGCLLVVACVLVAFAFASLVFGAYVQGMYFVRGTEQSSARTSQSGVFTPAVPPHYFVDVVRPNAWLFIPLVASAIGLFVVSLLLLLGSDL